MGLRKGGDIGDRLRDDDNDNDDNDDEEEEEDIYV
jgi:hypothetical protein